MLPFVPKIKDPSNLLADNISSQEFSEAVSTFKFGKTFKTTNPNRHQKTDEFILPYCKPSFNFLDVGASTGITSFELMQKLEFKFNKFFVTDFNLSINCAKYNGENYYFTEDGDCILIAGKSFIKYPQESSLITKIYKERLHEAEQQTLEKILLIIPELRKKIDVTNAIGLMRHNVLNPWKDESLDIIKAANLFNRSYFSDQEILKGVGHLFDALNDKGLLVIIDNREKEKSSIFQKSSSALEPIKTIEGGTEVHSLIESKF